MTDKRRISHISKAISDDIESIFASSFFLSLQQGQIELQGLKRFACEYYLASNGFPQLLALACAQLPTDELRMPFVTNLWDEHGRGVKRKSHRAMLLKFLDFLRVVPEDNPSGPAAKYLAAMKALVQQASSAQLLGIFGPGCESFTPRQYKLLLAILREHFSIPLRALEFFADHIRHDGDHLAQLNESLRTLIVTPIDMADAITGARAAIAIERRFWIDMHAHCT